MREERSSFSLRKMQNEDNEARFQQEGLDLKDHVSSITHTQKKKQKKQRISLRVAFSPLSEAID